MIEVVEVLYRQYFDNHIIVASQKLFWQIHHTHSASSHRKRPLRALCIGLLFGFVKGAFLKSHDIEFPYIHQRNDDLKILLLVPPVFEEEFEFLILRLKIRTKRRPPGPRQIEHALGDVLLENELLFALGAGSEVDADVEIEADHVHVFVLAENPQDGAYVITELPEGLPFFVDELFHHLILCGLLRVQAWEVRAHRDIVFLKVGLNSFLIIKELAKQFVNINFNNF